MPSAPEIGTGEANSANATYAFIVLATASPSENPVADMMIEMGNNTQRDSAVNTTPVLNAPSQTSDSSIVDVDPLWYARVAAPVLPAEGLDTDADGAPQGEDTLEYNDKLEKDTTHTASFRRGRGDMQALDTPPVAPVWNPL